LRVFLFHSLYAMIKKIPVLFLICAAAAQLQAQATVGLLQQGLGDQPGFVLFAPVSYTRTYLIDKCGYEVHSWNSSYKPGNSVYFLEDGNLLRTGNTLNPNFNGGGKGGILEKIDWNDNVVWSYQVSSSTLLQHHDIKPLPNGNVLVIAWEEKTAAAAIANGRDPNLLGSEFWNEKIMELQPSGSNSATVVWEWNVWDHLVQEFDSSKLNYDTVSQHPELVNINYEINGSSNADWLHLNSVDYNAQLDEIILSSRFFNEVWVIDHSTTSAQAAGHAGGNHGKGGDLLFRWGNPAAYNRGDTSEQQFYGQHSAHWIAQGLKDAGDIMVFNNGKDRPEGEYSTVDIIRPVKDSAGNYLFNAAAQFLPDSAHWVYKAPNPTDFYSMNISGAQRLQNGNTLICSGASGLFFEIDSLKNTLWQYKCPVNGTGPVSQGSTLFLNNVFRTILFDSSYAGFAGHVVTPGAPIELNPLSYNCPSATGIAETALKNFSVSPNPGKDLFSLSATTEGLLIVYNASGIKLFERRLQSGINSVNLADFPAGIYFFRFCEAGGRVAAVKVVRN
jgi:hypothetical protein